MNVFSDMIHATFTLGFSEPWIKLCSVTYEL